MSESKEFDLEYQYQQYLKRVALSEDRMNAVQRVETKRAFMGACGQMLVILRDELSKLEEDAAIEKLKDMFIQVGNFWTNQTHKLN